MIFGGPCEPSRHPLLFQLIIVESAERAACEPVDFFHCFSFYFV